MFSEIFCKQQVKDHTNAICAHVLLQLVEICAPITAACIDNNCKTFQRSTWVFELMRYNVLCAAADLWISHLSNSTCKCISTCTISNNKVRILQ